jgi:acyl-CoA reductase-like NAD-dependent aldehyde dehydrogenase
MATGLRSRTSKIPTADAGTAGGLASAQVKLGENSGKHDYTGAVAKLRAYFNTGKTKDMVWRKAQLKALRRMMAENLDEWTDALCADLGRSKAMAVFGDLNSVVGSVDYCLDNVDAWAANRKKPLKLELAGGSAYQRPEPKGVCLNIAPWNFPVELILSPLAYMIAAGNCCVIKPSEISAHCAAVFAKLIPKYLDPSAFFVVTGGVPETTALLECRFDHILYTGNNFVAKIVMAAAAKHLTPVTLELGGKSPVIIDAKCDIKAAVKRVLNIKAFNCGQICLSPDYVLLHKDQEEAFYTEAAAVMKTFYPEGQHESASYDRIINTAHWNRLRSMLESDHGGEVVMGGLEHSDEDSKLFVTTLVKNPSLTSRLMQEEIFGPILPVFTVPSVAEAVAVIQGLDQPLGLYVFSKSQATVDFVLANTTSGGVTINDVLMHILVEELPFGGIGPSGTGCVHGRAGFDEVSHLRSVLDRGTLGLDFLAQARYPPHDEAKHQLLRKMTLHAHGIKKGLGLLCRCAAVGLVAYAGVVASRLLKA